jgi:hypothetical protein
LKASPADYYYWYTNTQTDINNSGGGFVPFVCTISYTLQLTCVSGQQNMFYTCPAEASGPPALIGTGQKFPSDCQQFTATVIAA